MSQKRGEGNFREAENREKDRFHSYSTLSSLRAFDSLILNATIYSFRLRTISIQGTVYQLSSVTTTALDSLSPFVLFQTTTIQQQEYTSLERVQTRVIRG